MHRFSILRQLTVLAALGCTALASQAVVVPWYTSLDEVQAGQLIPTGQPGAPGGTSNPGDNPAFPSSSGTGTGFGTYDTDTHVLSWNFTIDGLSSTATLAHFHFGAPGVFRGPIRVERPSLDIGSLLGATFGSFSGSQDFDDAFDPGLPAGGLAQLEQELLSGNWYINIHTGRFGAGEIRGQILIPEPAALSLVGLALLAAGAASRRRT